ncbi:hypothetical protein NBRC116493_34490 [Aurantivibrio infirmus]
MRIIIALFVLTTLLAPAAYSAEFSYDEIAKRYDGSSLGQETVKGAKMQGECLVGLKELTFKKKDKFDPVAEWTNYRSASLLEQYSPCEVLIMMEIAQAKLRATNQ